MILTDSVMRIFVEDFADIPDTITITPVPYRTALWWADGRWLELSPDGNLRITGLPRYPCVDTGDVPLLADSANELMARARDILLDTQGDKCSRICDIIDLIPATGRVSAMHPDDWYCEMSNAQMGLYPDMSLDMATGMAKHIESTMPLYARGRRVDVFTAPLEQYYRDRLIYQRVK